MWFKVGHRTIVLPVFPKLRSQGEGQGLTDPSAHLVPTSSPAPPSRATEHKLAAEIRQAISWLLTEPLLWGVKHLTHHVFHPGACRAGAWFSSVFIQHKIVLLNSETICSSTPVFFNPHLSTCLYWFWIERKGEKEKRRWERETWELPPVGIPAESQSRSVLVCGTVLKPTEPRSQSTANFKNIFVK